MTKIDLLKIDVEGAELRVLKGAKESLAKGKIFRIVAELHPPFVRCPKRLVSLLQEFGYTVTLNTDLRFIYAFKNVSID